MAVPQITTGERLKWADESGDGKEGEGPKYNISYRNGRIVVVHTPEVHEQIEDLLDNTRQPQVQLGANLARQKARGIVQDTNGDTDDDGAIALTDGQAVTNKQAFERFYNYNYVRSVSADNEPEVGWGFQGAQRGFVDFEDVKRNAGGNFGQKVDVNSRNLNVSSGVSRQLGVTFKTGKNNLRFATVDEATFRTLNELDAGNKRKVAAPNQRLQETIIGTNALVANGMLANVAFGADVGNELNIADNPIKLQHEDYILIDNGGYLTAVKAGQMQHWTQAPAAVQFAEVPQDIDVPALGRLVRFEKTLVDPTDDLVIRAAYSWKGDTR